MSKKAIAIAIILIWQALVWVIYSWSDASTDSIAVMGVVGLIQLVINLQVMTRFGYKVLSPYGVMLFVLYLFTFGQSFLFGIDDAVPARYDVRLKSSIESIYNSQFITLLFLNFFNIGGIISIDRRFNYRAITEQSILLQQRGLRMIGYIMAAVSVVPFIIVAVEDFIIVSKFGYAGLYETDVKVGIANSLQILADYFVPAMLCLLMSGYGLGRLQKIVLCVLILDIVFVFYLGARNNGVILIALVMLYYYYNVKPFTKKQYALIGVGAVGLLIVINVIGIARESVNSNTGDILSDSDPVEMIESSISEMGGSIFPLIATQEFVPATEDYRYGSTFLYATTSLIPNLGFWDVHPAMVNANLGDWLKKKLGINYGPGFSLVAECYINWGYFGFILMMALGWLFGKFMLVSRADKYRPLKLLIAFVLMFLTLSTVRNSFLATIRSLAYVVFPIYLAVKIYSRNYLNRQRRLLMIEKLTSVNSSSDD